jgi:proteic killer suppression protein
MTRVPLRVVRMSRIDWRKWSMPESGWPVVDALHQKISPLTYKQIVSIVLLNMSRWLLIKTFKDKVAEAVFHGYQHPAVPPDLIVRAKTKLQVLHAATSIADLKISYSNHLEVLKDDSKGQMSIRISRQWRICFNWIDNNAYDVEIVDYH